MCKPFVLRVAVMALAIGPVVAQADYYAGSLTSQAGGITPASSAWAIAWEITGSGTAWHYEYTLSNTAEVSFSEVILESPGFGGSLENVSGATAEVGVFTVNPPNPNPFNGIRFTPLVTASSATWSFDSDMAPMWSNFYARDFSGVTAYNSGFGLPLADPYDPASSPGAFLLVPDCVAPIPVPGAALLGLLGFSLIGWVKRRFS